VATIVFFTHRFTPGQREWIEQAGGDGGWDHGTGFWLGSAFEPGSPFDTPWRRVKGPLWDVGPHALSVLAGALGPVREVRALSGRRGLVTLLMSHQDGATSTAALSLSAPVAAARSGATLWGPDGVTEMPPSTAPVTDALGVAIRELTAAAREGGEHPCGVSFGRDVVAVLADAEAQLAEHEQGGVTRIGGVRTSDDG
jgi:predicted dehydrogenase